HSLGHLLDIVLGRRGGAPLHFLLSFVVVHLGGGLGALRLLSAVFAVASVPLVGLIGARLAGRTAGLAAAALASASWVLLFHGVYGRMYSLFLFTSALSYLALLRALAHGGRRLLRRLRRGARRRARARDLRARRACAHPAVERDPHRSRLRDADGDVPRRELRLADLARVAPPDLRAPLLLDAPRRGTRPARAAPAPRGACARRDGARGPGRPRGGVGQPQ